MVKIPQELLVVSETYNKDVHKKTSMIDTFQDKVNEKLKAGYRVVNCTRNVSGPFPVYVAFLVRDI